MEITQATLDDLEGVMALLKKYHIDSIAAADKGDGFVTTNITPQQLETLVTREDGITVARHEGGVAAFALAASWQYWSAWPLFAYMIEKLPEHACQGQVLSIENSYQYGPICIDGAVRGTGVFEQVFRASLASMADRYPFMVTFINQINRRSHAAHTRKAPMEVIGTFRFNNNDYYTLACPTRP